MSQTTNINQESVAHDVEARKIAARAAQSTPSTTTTAAADLPTLLERLRPAVFDLSNLTDCAAMAERMLMTWMRAQEAVSQVCPDLKLLNDSIATLKNLTSVRKSLIRLTCLAESLSRPGSPTPASNPSDSASPSVSEGPTPDDTADPSSPSPTPSADPISPISPISPIGPIPAPVHKVHPPTMDPMSIANYIWWNGLDMEIYSQPKVRDFIGMPPVPDFPRPPISASATQEIRDPQLTPEPREPSVKEVPEVPFVPLDQLAPTLAQATDTIKCFHRPESTDSFPRGGRRSTSKLLPKAEREARMAEIDRLREENRRLHPEDYLPPEQRYRRPPT